MNDSRRRPPSGLLGTGILTLRVADDDLGGGEMTGARAVVDCRDTTLVDGHSYLIRAAGRGWLRRYRAGDGRLVADRPNRPGFDRSCHIVGRIVCIARDL